ncbi:MAG: hypothetical protein IKF66_01185 [Methanobrevibacter sp.]|nr:hypothetical protein [Methanobrevibacter sp.]
MENQIVLPPKPQRSEIKTPAELKDYALIIIYYENLVEQWELWGETAEKIIYAEKREYPVEK